MLSNLAAQGVPQKGERDLETIKLYHPEAVSAFALLCWRMGIGLGWLFSGSLPDCFVSGYRQVDPDPAVKHSPHGFANAFDIQVSNLNAHIPSNQGAVLEQQIKWIEAAIGTGLFSRAGFYVQQNTIHLDQCDKEWCQTYGGTSFWVKNDNKYTGFGVLTEAEAYAKQCVINNQG